MTNSFQKLVDQMNSQKAAAAAKPLTYVEAMTKASEILEKAWFTMTQADGADKFNQDICIKESSHYNRKVMTLEVGDQTLLILAEYNDGRTVLDVMPDDDNVGSFTLTSEDANLVSEIFKNLISYTTKDEDSSSEAPAQSNSEFSTFARNFANMFDDPKLKSIINSIAGVSADKAFLDSFGETLVNVLNNRKDYKYSWTSENVLTIYDKNDKLVTIMTNLPNGESTVCLGTPSETNPCRTLIGDDAAPVKKIMKRIINTEKNSVIDMNPREAMRKMFLKSLLS